MNFFMVMLIYLFGMKFFEVLCVLLCLNLVLMRK